MTQWNKQSPSEFWFEDVGRDVKLFIEVKGCGVLVMRGTTGHEDGRIRFEGVSLFSDNDIRYAALEGASDDPTYPPVGPAERADDPPVQP